MKFSMPDVGIKYPVDYTEEKGIDKILAKSRNYSKVIERLTYKKLFGRCQCTAVPIRDVRLLN